MLLNKRGFTLLELMIVVIIIGILASLAIPQYIKTIERARAAEAFANLDSIRSAMQRYWTDQLARTGTGTYDPASLAPGANQLDIDDPNSAAWRYFDYSLSTAAATPNIFSATATRLTGKTAGAVPAVAGVTIANATVTIDQDGSISYGTAW